METVRSQEENESLRPLARIRAGQTVRLARIDAGRDLNSRLAAMGLVAGVEIRVVSNQHPGPFVISVRDTRMALGRGMAQKIMVL